MIAWCEVMRRTTTRKSTGEVLQDIYPRASKVTEKAANRMLNTCEDIVVTVERVPEADALFGPKRSVRWADQEVEQGQAQGLARSPEARPRLLSMVQREGKSRQDGQVRAADPEEAGSNATVPINESNRLIKDCESEYRNANAPGDRGDRRCGGRAPQGRQTGKAMQGEGRPAEESEREICNNSGCYDANSIRIYSRGKSVCNSNSSGSPKKSPTGECIEAYETAESRFVLSSMKLISRDVTSDIGYQLIGDSANLLQSDRSEEECKYVLMTSEYEHDDDYEQSHAIRTNSAQFTLDMCLIAIVCFALFVPKLTWLRRCLCPSDQLT